MVYYPAHDLGMMTRSGIDSLNTYRSGADTDGRFGIYGGRFVAETLMPLVLAVEKAYDEAKADPGFAAEMECYA